MSARVAVMGSGSWGTAFALVLSDAGQSVTMWARRPELAAAITSSHRNVDYFPTIELPPSLIARVGCGRGHGRRGVRGAGRAVAVVAGQPRGLVHPAGCRGGESGQGHRTRYGSADERGDRRGGLDPAGADRRGDRPQPRPGDRRAPTLGQRRRQHPRRDRDGAAEHLSHGPVPGVHQRRRDRLRVGRSHQERDRSRRRDGDRSGPGRQRDGLGDHPRAGRGHPARTRARRRPVHVLRAGRPR